MPQWFRTAAAALPGAVLLETAKFDDENHRSLLFLDPICELTAWAPDDVQALFAEVDLRLRQGRLVAGFVSYECGEGMQGIAPRTPQAPPKTPLLRMGVFHSPVLFDHRTGLLEGGDSYPDAHERIHPSQPVAIHQAHLQITPEDYEQRIRTIQDHLAAGHSYQVNFTDKVAGRFTGTSLDLYEHVLSRQPVSYAAFVNLGGQQILSFSPELFYRVQDRRISVRPMKGTWPRGRNIAEDEEAARSLRDDEKNRAEHVTIVDLLRNDLGRVCIPGSVQVDSLLCVERYRTLHQMTSRISGTLQPFHSPAQVFQSLFPSGSVTGAPKRRTMEIIQETENEARGVYTGSIGFFGPQGEALFNVAIRTLLAEDGAFLLGVGGGITADSTPVCEYGECRLKASFLTTHQPDFHLMETMRAVAGTIPRLERHLARMRDSAAYFGFPFDQQGIRLDLSARLSQHAGANDRVKLSLEAGGRWQIEVSPLEEVPWSGNILLWPEPVHSSDVFLQHKTSHRPLYHQALLQAQRQGFDEVLFWNEEGLLTEGAITNAFVAVHGKIVTPDTGCGLLPGVERAHTLSSRVGAQVGRIPLEILWQADRIWLANSLRGSRPVSLVSDSKGTVLWQRTGKMP